MDDYLGDGGSINRLDRFFDSIFQDDLETMRERFAEIRFLVGEGDIEGAKEILEHYRNVADELESDVSPEQRDEAVRLSRFIRRAVEDIEERISDSDRGDFEFISETAENVGTAAELASKIKELCIELSGIDPVAYERTCGADEDSAPWLKSLHDDLTDEQEDEAREFGEILSSCMRTSGEDCRCEDISFVAMQEMCITARPLAIACDIEGEEDSCDKLDSLDFPEMPDYLRDVADRLDDQYDDDNYDNHFPGACRDASIRPTDSDAREACFAIMVEIEAPPECRDAIKEAGVTNERGAREICEKIMFDREAPEQCINAGINDPRECGELMRELGFDGDRGHRGPDCGGIEDSGERLKCYDNFESGDFEDDFREDYRRDFGQDFDDFNRDRRDFRGRFGAECPQEKRDECLDQGGRWDCSQGYVDCRFDDYEDYDRERIDIGRDRHNFDCSIIDCQQGYICDRYEGCINEDRQENDGVDCHSIGSSNTCQSEGCWWDLVFNNCRFEGEDKDDDLKDYGCSGESNCPVYSICENGNWVCYGEEYNEDNDPGRYDEGGYKYCDEGYESDGSGGCIPFGTGDYDFPEDDGELGSYGPGDYDEGGDYSGSESSGSWDSYDSGSDSGSSGGDSGGDSSSSSGGDGGGSGSSGDGDGSSGTGSVIRGITGNAVGGNKFLEYYYRR